MVGLDMWNKLGFSDILRQSGLSEREVEVAKAVIIAKLVAPASDLATFNWLKHNSALNEICGLDDLKKDAVYEIADTLFEQAKHIENALYNVETSLFQLERRLFLFDLTTANP